MVKTLLKCADLQTLPVGIASVLAGAAAAAVNGNFEWLTVSVCLLFIVCFQITANIVHRYSVVLQHSGEHVEEYIQYSQREMQFPLKKVLREGIGVMGMLTIIFSLITLNIEKDRHFGKHTLATIFGLKGTQLFLTLASALAVGAAAFGSVLFMKSIWWIPTLIVAGAAGVNVWVARRLGASLQKDYPSLTAWINWTSLAIQLVFVILFLTCGASDPRGIDYL